MKKISNLIKQPFLAGSVLVLLGVNLYNFGQMIFHLVIGRLLGREAYAEFAALVSIMGIIVIVQQALGLTLIKFVSSGKNEKYITNFTRWVFRWSIFLGAFFGVLFWILSPILINFLHINQYSIILIIGPILFLLIILNTLRSIFQGLLKFSPYILNLLLEAIIKISLAVVFIFWGWATFGVMFAIAVGVLFGIFLASLSLKRYLFGKREKPPDILSLFKYSIPVFFLSLALTSMNSSDIILVKHFFPSSEAGLYAALAKLGSIAFFGAAPVSTVMFPFISRSHSKGEPYNKLFYLSVLMVLVISIPVVIFYKVTPELIVQLLYGNQFVAGSDILWWFGVYMLMLGLAVLFTQFYLSVGKTKAITFFVMAAFLQIILISFIHSSILMVIQASIISVTLLIGALIVYFPYHRR